MKRKHSEARRIRIELGAKCPCIIYWRGQGKQKWRWTLFASNGQVQDASTESFSSIAIAIANYNKTYDLMRKLGRYISGYQNAGHYIEPGK